MAKELAAEHPDWVMLYQYGNPANAHAHYEGTGPEILRDLPDDHPLRRRAWAPPARSWASAATCASTSPDVQIVAAEPRYGELVYGLRNIDEGFVPELYDASRADLPLLGRPATTRCAAPASWSSTRASSPASPPARSCTPRWPSPTRRSAAGERADIVFVVCDGGWKYLSTGAYAGSLEDAAEGLEGQLWA